MEAEEFGTTSGPKTWSLELPYGLKRPRGPCLWILLIVVFVSSWASLAGAIQLDSLTSVVHLVVLCVACYVFFIMLSWFMITNNYCCFKILHINPLYRLSLCEQLCLCHCSALDRSAIVAPSEDEEGLLSSLPDDLDPSFSYSDDVV